MGFEVVPHRSWIAFYEDASVKQALSRIEEELEGTRYYPLPNEVLRFMTTDLLAVKYILVGQDPYYTFDRRHSRPQATGRSFEASELIGEGWERKTRCRALQNILKAAYVASAGKKGAVTISEIRQQIRVGNFKIAPPGELFDILERQGVLFLNAALTVPPNDPGVHLELWGEFRGLLVDYVIRYNVNARWFLWGGKVPEHFDNLPENVIAVKCCHPCCARFIEDSGIDSIKVDWWSRE